MSYRVWLPVFVTALCHSCGVQATVCHQNSTQWSNTKPSVNLGYVITGEIDNRGMAVGFHSRHQGQDPDGAYMVKRLKGPNNKGIYTGQVMLCHGSGWTPKNGFSSFFPDGWTQEQLIQKVIQAYHASGEPKFGKWSGVVDGITIEGFMCPKGQPDCPEGSINNAYPVYF